MFRPLLYFASDLARGTDKSSAGAARISILIHNIYCMQMQDEKELIRNLSSSMDGPEMIMDAEEYLQPKARGPLPSTSTVETPLPNTPVKKYPPSTNGSDQGVASYGAEGFSSHRSHTVAGSPASSLIVNNIRDNGPHLRYCTDPIQLIGKGTIVLNRLYCFCLLLIVLLMFF